MGLSRKQSAFLVARIEIAAEHLRPTHQHMAGLAGRAIAADAAVGLERGQDGEVPAVEEGADLVGERGHQLLLVGVPSFSRSSSSPYAPLL